MSSALRQKALQTVWQYGMLQKNDAILIALSGGADSVALLHFLCGVQEDFALKLMVAHVNHGLRGDESLRDEQFVRQICTENGLPLFVECADVARLAKTNAVSIEEAGRDVRYRFFAGLSEKHNAKIATAHTRSDSVETALLNWTRGTALRGLCGIPALRGNIIRPLIDCTRREIEQFCSENKLDFVTDSSNKSDAYTRNRLRHQVMPVLLGVNANLHDTVGATMQALQADANYLDKLAREMLDTLNLGQNLYERQAFLALDAAIWPRVLLFMLEQRGLRVDRSRLFAMRDYIAAGSGGMQLSNRYTLTCGCDSFSIAEQPGQPEQVGYFELPVQLEQPVCCVNVFSDKKITLIQTEYEHCEENFKSTPKLLKNALDCDMIKGVISFRPKVPADCIRLQSRGCTKSLKKLFNEAGLTAQARAKTVVLADETGPLWVEGFGVSERAAVSPQTKRVLFIKVEDVV